MVAGIDAKDEERLYVQDLSGGPPRAVTDDGVTLAKIGRPVSPDGRRVVALGSDDVPALYPLEGGPPSPVPGLTANDVPVCWTPDGRELFVLRAPGKRRASSGSRWPSGRTRPWHGLGRSLPSGL